MTTSKNPRRMRRLQESLSTFIVAFDNMMELHGELPPHGPGQGLLPTARRLDDADPDEAQQRVDLVSRLAGECEGVAAMTGITISVHGVGVLDPITNWSFVFSPKAVFRPSEIRTWAVQAQGTLNGLIADAEEEEPDLPSLGPASLHPTVWSAAAPLWTMHQLPRAIQAATDALIDRMADDYGQRRDVQEASRWQQLFSTDPSAPGRPRLRWPGDPEDLTVKSIQKGLGQLGTGIQLVLRNAATHSRDKMGEQEAFERLAALSLMARLMDGCEVVPAPEE